MDHETLQQLLPAYSIGATDPDEERLLRRHLRVCQPCRALLADYEALRDSLLWAVPPATVPPRLVEQMRHQLVVSRPGLPRRLGFAGSRLPVAAGLVVAVILLLVTNLYWYKRVMQVEQEAAAQAAAIAALGDAPFVVLQGDTPAPDAWGRLYFHPEGSMALLRVEGLPVTPPGKAYQVWLVRDGQRDSGGLFRVGPGEKTAFMLINAPRSLHVYERIGVTMEPADGSPEPTSPRMIGGSL